jgi:redox-sensitive bicupin YhaK (pirin superfamily)
MTDRAILKTFRKPGLHWVGDGFATQTMLPYETDTAHTSPFLLAGYNPPRHFEPTDSPRGVGMHPHRGFETVTVVFDGAVAHADTMGNRGEIGAGGVQWMTAGSGVQHEEFHADRINREGGTLEMVQLWVNLPEAHRMTAPRYQDVAAAEIPAQTLEGGGTLRVIAGTFGGVEGPVETFSPLALLDVRQAASTMQDVTMPEGWSQSLLLLSGRLRLADGREIEGPETVIFDRSGGTVAVEALAPSHYLVLAGEPLDEPLFMGGPFVAGSEAALRQAYADFRNGAF